MSLFWLVLTFLFVVLMTWDKSMNKPFSPEVVIVLFICFLMYIKEEICQSIEKRK